MILTYIHSISCDKTRGYRIDSYNSNGNGRFIDEQDPERKIRLEEHKKRIQNELALNKS